MSGSPEVAPAPAARPPREAPAPRPAAAAGAGSARSLPKAGAPQSAARHRALALALLAISLATIAYLAWSGRDYYTLPLAQRVRSPLHDRLKPGGVLGRRLGIAGSALMLANLAYYLRRRVKVLQRLGSQRAWLEVHVFCGLTGPAILVFHSAFLTNNLVARVTAVSTAVVVAAGVVGRYLYAQLPRNIYGKEMDLAEIARAQRELIERLAALLPEGHDAGAIVERFALPAPAGKKAAPRLVLRSLRADLGRLLSSFILARYLRRRGLDRRHAREAARTTRRAAALGLRIVQLTAFQRILSRWRGVHLRLTVVMLVAMVLHVAVVTLLGYGLV
jgi:hypothetical protein